MKNLQSFNVDDSNKKDGAGGIKDYEKTRSTPGGGSWNFQNIITV